MNQRQELFCQGVFEGKTATEAYILAGYSAKTAAHSAHRLLENAGVQARLKQLNDAATTPKIMTVTERKERLSEIASARYTDFVTAGPDGSWINIGPENAKAGAIKKITSKTLYDKDGDHPAVIISVELHDPGEAIRELNKMDGVYPAAKVDVTSKGEQIKPATYPVGNGNLGNVLRGLVDIGAVKVVQN